MKFKKYCYVLHHRNFFNGWSLHSIVSVDFICYNLLYLLFLCLSYYMIKKRKMFYIRVDLQKRDFTSTLPTHNKQQTKIINFIF